MDDLKVNLKGQGHQVKLSHLTVLHEHSHSQRSRGSRSKVTLYKVKGHVVQGHPKAHNVGRWAHINVKLLYFSNN